MGGGFGAGGVDFLAVLCRFLGEGGDFVRGGVEVYHHDFAGFEVVRVERAGADRGGDIVPAVIVQGALHAWGAEKLEDILPRALADLNLSEARGEDDLAAGVDGLATGGDKHGGCRYDGESNKREAIMFFHWLKHYGKVRSGATDVVDDIFARARAASPKIFEGDSTVEPERQAKFEYMCPWVAAALLGRDEAGAKAVLEVMIDRLEIGLREGGVGDMKVGVHVRKYAAALHGRVRRYMSLMDSGDWKGLEAALGEHGVEKALAASLRNAGGRGEIEKVLPKPKKGLQVGAN